MTITPSAPTVSTEPLWGRAYKLSVVTSAGEQIVLSQSGWEPEALRVVFEVQESLMPSPCWYAMIHVYNADQPDLQNLLWLAEWVTLEAGYQTGTNKSTIIWNGPVLQVMFDRPGIVDTVITFNCVSTIPQLEEGFQNYARGENTSQYEVVSQMMSKQGGSIDSQASALAKEALRTKTYPRGKTHFGTSGKYMQVVSSDNFITHWVKGDQDNISELYNPDANPPQKPEIVYGPPYPPGYVTSGPGPSNAANITRSIIGTPQQSQWGVNLEVLLDPRLHVGTPPQIIQIEQGALIAQSKFQLGTIPTPLDNSGLFVVGQVTHHGDTRGNEWYSSVQGYTRLYCSNLLNGVLLAAKLGVTAPK